MHKDLILLKTVKSFCEIAVGELELQLKYDTGSPEKVSNPLYESTKDLLHSALRKGIAKILEKQNLALPEKMTHSELVDKLIDTQVVDQFIVEPPDLMRIYNLLEDLILSWHPLSYHFFFRYAAPRARSERTKWTVVMSEFAPISIYLVISPLVSLILLGLPFPFASNSSTYPEKLSAYECGFDPFGDARSRFDIRFYLVSILFIIPDPEVTFSFPWAVPPNKIDLFGFWSMMAFLLILTIGSFYEWKRGASDRDSGSPRFWCFGHLSMAVRGISLLSNGKRASPRKCPFACRWGSKSDFIVPRNSVTWPVSQQALRQADITNCFKSVRQVSELDKAAEDFQRI
ncbi:hypothetical protein GQ457_03G016610 [Hibiscus cannabinus]